MENKEAIKENTEGRPDFGYEYLDHTVKIQLYYIHKYVPTHNWQRKILIKSQSLWMESLEGERIHVFGNPSRFGQHGQI